MNGINFNALDIKVKAQFFRDLFSRLVSLLRVHCTGRVIILSEDVDEEYIKLRGLVELIIGAEGLESLLEMYPKSILPDTLHDLGEYADVDWEDDIQPGLNRYTGKIIEFCVKVSAGYDDNIKESTKVLLDYYDKFIESYSKDKSNAEKDYLNRVEISANRIKQQFQVDDKSLDVYVDTKRIKELRNIKSDDFDLSKIIEMCDELNNCFSNEANLAVAMLVRAMLDHVPPIFGCKNFSEVSNNYAGGGNSFRHSMANLENSLRKIADAHLHTQIRKRESLPNKTQVNFRSDLDVLLLEIIRILK
jgi:hypothetical protein